MRLSFLNKKIIPRLVILLLLMFLLIVFVLKGIFPWLSTLSPILYVLVLCAIIVPFVIAAKQLQYRYLKGFEAEGEIGVILKTLPKEFHCFHDIVLGNNGNIDYVVIGPTGIWTIEVKSTKGNITVREGDLFVKGRVNEHVNLRQPYAQSIVLKKYLLEKLNKSYDVHPVLVFSNKFTRIRFGLHPLNGVFVIGASWLYNLLTQSEINNILSLNEIQECIKYLKAM